MNLEFNVNSLFKPLFLEHKRYYLLAGGRGRGASTAVSQYLVSRLVAKEYARIALMRANHSDIRISLWRELMDRIEEQNAQGSFKITDNDMRITYGRNFAQAMGFRASSGEHTAKLKSLANFNVVVIEEAEEIGEQEFMTLDDSLRTVKGDIKVILVFNPPHRNHWLIQRFFDLEPSEKDTFFIPKLKDESNAIYIGGTYLDNRKNIDEATRDRYESYRSTKPDYYWQIIRGLVPEVLRGKIFSGWRQIDEIPYGAQLVGYGLDGGWFPDPLVLVAVYKEPTQGYIFDELLYNVEIDNDTVAQTILSTNKNVLCRADLDERSIAELKNRGVNIVKVQREPGSVLHRIKVLSRQRVSVASRSAKLWQSYENYAWQVTKDGDIVGKPDHYLSDGMDACMYGIEALPEVEAVERVRREIGRNFQSRTQEVNPV